MERDRLVVIWSSFSGIYSLRPLSWPLNRTPDSFPVAAAALAVVHDVGLRVDIERHVGGVAVQIADGSRSEPKVVVIQSRAGRDCRSGKPRHGGVAKADGPIGACAKLVPAGVVGPSRGFDTWSGRRVEGGPAGREGCTVHRAVLAKFGPIRILGILDRRQKDCALGHPGLLDVSRERRHRDRREDAHDGDGDHQLKQRKAGARTWEHQTCHLSQYISRRRHRPLPLRYTWPVGSEMSEMSCRASPQLAFGRRPFVLER